MLVDITGAFAGRKNDHMKQNESRISQRLVEWKSVTAQFVLGRFRFAHFVFYPPTSSSTQFFSDFDRFIFYAYYNELCLCISLVVIIMERP